jgi:hypothetical protein
MNTDLTDFSLIFQSVFICEIYVQIIHDVTETLNLRQSPH